MKYTIDQIKTVKAMAKEGWTREQIAKKTKMGIASVAYYLKGTSTTRRVKKPVGRELSVKALQSTITPRMELKNLLLGAANSLKKAANALK